MSLAILLVMIFDIRIILSQQLRRNYSGLELFGFIKSATWPGKWEDDQQRMG
jgi:hypothetical protein